MRLLPAHSCGRACGNRASTRLQGGEARPRCGGVRAGRLQSLARSLLQGPLLLPAGLPLPTQLMAEAVTPLSRGIMAAGRKSAVAGGLEASRAPLLPPLRSTRLVITPAAPTVGSVMKRQMTPVQEGYEVRWA